MAQITNDPKVVLIKGTFPEGENRLLGSRVPDDVNLIDVLDYIVAYRKKNEAPPDLRDGLLQGAFQNTIKLFDSISPVNLEVTEIE